MAPAEITSGQPSPRTPRHREGPGRLLRRAAGPVGGLPGKVGRLVQALRAYGDRAALEARLDAIQARGLCQQRPTPLQLGLGAYDMLRFFISPAAASYYEDQGLSYGFHQLLRVLEEPASMVDPIGLFATRETLIGHLLQVTHANPRYDLQVLETHPGGLAELERQLEAMEAGVHPKAAEILAIVEDGAYHGRLLAYVRAYRRDPEAPPPIRANILADAALREREVLFGTLPAALRYCARMPRSLRGALRHLRTVRAPLP